MLLALALLAAPHARANDLIDGKIRADMLKRSDGRVAHIETEYNDIFITKCRNELTMSFQLKGYDYTESVANLHRPGRFAGALHAGDDARHRVSARR